MKSLLQYLGIEAERYQTAWISGAEGLKFQETMKKLVIAVSSLGPNRKLKEAR